MKILHLVYSSSYHIGGVEIFSIDAIRELHKRGVEQFVFCRKHPHIFERLHQARIPYEFMDFVRWKKWFNHKRVLRKIKSYAPDIVHCWHPRAAIYMPANSGVPVLGWFGNYSNLKHYATCNYYMGVSSEMCNYIGHESGHPDRVFLGNTFGTLPKDPPLSREGFRIPNDKPVILMLTRMNGMKGVDILLRAVVDLDVFLLLAGDGPELENYRNLARVLEIESRVRFIGWRDDRSALLGIADILAAPSRGYEGCPTVMPEAWSKGVPVVATRAQGLREYIRHGKNGMLSDVEDVEGLARNLRAVLEDSNLRKQLIAGGTRTYESQFSKEIVMKNLLDTYKEIIHRGIVP